jgi:lysine 6-dehydrogenase
LKPLSTCFTVKKGMTDNNVLLAGAGAMGSEIAIDLLAEQRISSLVVVDSSKERLDDLAKVANIRLGKAQVKDRLDLRRVNVLSERAEFRKLLSYAEIGIGALPHGIAETAVNAAIKSGTNYIDLIFSWSLKDIGEMDRRAKDAGITLVPACGLAPGLTNILAKRGEEELGGAEDVKIMVGGIPESPVPPLEYRILFSVESVLEEYTRRATVIRNGTRISLPALSEVEQVAFRQLPGRVFEAFITDGLSTLPFTLRARRMEEKTIRWPGHAEKVSFLKSLGLLSKKKMLIPGSHGSIAPRSFLSFLLSERLKLKPGERDMTLLRVSVTFSGKRIDFSMVDNYDQDKQVTSMARTTAYPCSSVAMMILGHRVKAYGFVPPEIAVKGELFEAMMQRLRDRGINIEKQVDGD